MQAVISHYKWHYLGLGILGPIFFFLPMANVNGEMTYIVFNYFDFVFSFLLVGLCYFLFIVPLNAIYGHIYKTSYLDKLYKWLSIIIPLFGIIGMIVLVTTDVSQSSQVNFTVYFYLMMVYFILIHTFNIYLMFTKKGLV